jgi:hypothetical protein
MAASSRIVLVLDVVALLLVGVVYTYDVLAQYSSAEVAISRSADF